MFLHIAMYLRLSQEDVDKRNNVLKDESNSIRSQRLLIQRYIQEHSELSAVRLWNCKMMVIQGPILIAHNSKK